MHSGKQKWRANLVCNCGLFLQHVLFSSLGYRCTRSSGEVETSGVLFFPSWNHAFKNQITTLQSQAKNRANPNRSEVQANLSLFLEAASGFYTQASLRDFHWWGYTILFEQRPKIAPFRMSTQPAFILIG